MEVAHHADKDTLEKRDVRQGQGATLDALARIADYYDKLPDMPREDQLQTLVEMLEGFEKIMDGAAGGGGGGDVTAEDVLKALQEFDPDVTHQFAALDIAREFFATTGANENFLMLLEQAHGEFAKGDLGRDVRAGMAAAKEAAQAQVTLETDPSAVREAYRAMLRGTQSMGQLFSTFRRFNMTRKFAEVVSAFMNVAGEDLASTGPSTDPAYLHSLITELSKLKKMQSAIELASELTRQTDRLLERGEKPEGDEADVAEKMLAFASNPAAGPGDARGMLSRYAGCSLATQLSFANGLRTMHAELPDDVMPSPQARLQQSTAILGMLDQLVEEEEAEYEQELSGAAPKGH
jgi:type III secretion system YopN/LcrE/InvE/MxiC family regulator